jgi:molybdenum cofactor cytidylyltransferase
MIESLLLAAGASRRFGEQKLLHPMPDGRPLILHSLANLGRWDPLVVIGEGEGALAGLLRGEGVRFTLCRDSALGMGHSLAHGVAMTPEADGWILALGDMPAIAPESIARVRQAMQQGAALAAPVYQGRRGHPVGIAARFRSELEGLQGDRGARGLLQRHADALILVPCDDPGILLDIDTPQDLTPLPVVGSA